MRFRALLLWIAIAALLSCQAAKQPKQHVFSAPDGTAIEYLDWGGRGDMVVLLAGLGDTAYIWSDFAPLLVPSHRVVALTRRGFGGSGPARSYGARESASDVVALLNHIDVRKAALVGHSIAGDEITAFAIEYPDRAQALVYIDAAYDRRLVLQVTGAVRNPIPAKQPTAADYASLAVLFSYFQRSDAYPGVYYRRIWSEAVRRNFEQSVVVDDAGHLKPRTAPAEFAKFIRVSGATSPNYSETRAPILAIYSDPEEPVGVPADASPELRQAIQRYQHDVVARCAAASVAQLRAARSDAQIVQIRGGLHHLFIQKPGEIARLVTEFLKRHSS